MSIVADAFLAAGVLAELICVLGVCWLTDELDQVHYSAASSTVGPALIAIAVGLTGFSSPSSTVEDIAACVVMIVLNPVLTHATARLAFHARGGRTREEEPTAEEMDR